MEDILERISIYLNSAFMDDPERIKHIYSVRDKALYLGKIHNCNLIKLEIAALLHDATKNNDIEEIREVLNNNYPTSIMHSVPEPCLHAYSAAVLANKYFKIEDKEILDAIKYHCTGRQAMNLIEQIIFVSDYVEDTRSFVSSTLRSLADSDLDLATYRIYEETIMYLKNNNYSVSNLTIKARNFYKNKVEAIHG